LGTFSNGVVPWVFNIGFFAQLKGAEARYVRDTADEDGDTEEENTGESIQDSEWFSWTKITVNLAKELNKQVEEVMRQPYIKTLFWLNFLKLRTEQEYINRKHG
jgi:hypothetical protein